MAETGEKKAADTMRKPVIERFSLDALTPPNTGEFANVSETVVQPPVNAMGNVMSVLLLVLLPGVTCTVPH